MGKRTDLADLARARGRHPVEAYAMVGDGLRHAARRLGRDQHDGDGRHLHARELVEGVLDVAAERWGLMALAVLRSWNLNSGEDVGEITYHLIECGVFGRQPSDSPDDFAGLPPFASALRERTERLLAEG